MKKKLKTSEDSYFSIWLNIRAIRRFIFFVQQNFTHKQKCFRVQHCKDIVEESKKNENFLYNSFTA